MRRGCRWRRAAFEAAFHFATRADFLRAAFAALRPKGVLLLADVVGSRGAGRVPAANRIADPAAYRALLAQVGFAGIAVEDVTDRTWTAFRRRYVRFALGRGLPALVRILPRVPWLCWRALVSDRGIGAYVTVVARRP
jgi:hypothetical protein